MQQATPPAIPIVIVAAAITATATLVAAIITWLKDRNGRARRIQVLDEATRYLQFWALVRTVENVSAENSEARDTFTKRMALATGLVEARGTYLPGRYGMMVYQTAIQILTGTTIFLVLGIVAYALYRLSALAPRTFLQLGIRAGSYVLFTVNLLLFAIFVTRTSIHVFRRLNSTTENE